MAFSMTKI